MTTQSGDKKRAASKGGAAPAADATGEVAAAPAAAPAADATGEVAAGSAKPLAPAPAPLLDVTVAVCESVAANQKRATEVLRQLGYRVAAQQSAEGIARRLSGQARPRILLVGLPGGEELIRTALSRAPDRPVIVASVPGPATTARARSEAAEADLFVLRPHSTDHLAAVLHAATTLAVERDRVQALQGTELILRDRLARYGQAEVSSGFQHFDFFKQFLVMELKRARRFGYPLALALVALDPKKPDEADRSPAVERKLRTRVASAIASSIRDIDLPIDYADDRMLVFMPYTDVDGAAVAGKRMAAAVRSHGKLQDGDREIEVSVSIGLASIKPGKPVSFSRLLKDAGAAVRAAQLKGGGRVVVRR